jgi:hypothetical protein
MSCRKGAGNSASTSLAKFLHAQTEYNVSHIFHVTRKAFANQLGDQAKVLADRKSVIEFYNKGLALAKNDPRVPEVRRASLVDRFNEAITDVSLGKKVPDNATFNALLGLEKSLSDEKILNDVVEVETDPTAGMTAEGLRITLSEVTLAKEKAKNLLDSYHAYNKYKPIITNEEDRRARAFKSLEAGVAWDQFSRMRDAYDATDVGFKNLLDNLPKDGNGKVITNTQNFDYMDWIVRVESAQTRIAKPSALALAREEAKKLGFEGSKAKQEEFASLLKIAEANYRSSLTPKKRDEYEKANTEYIKARRVYLYSLLERPDLNDIISSEDIVNPQTWARIESVDNISRVDLWAALEISYGDIDKSEVYTGLINDTAKAIRAAARAQARQAVLDEEGNGDYDPINRRFADNLKRKRSVGMQIK